MWAFADGKTYTTPAATHELKEGGDLPFSNVRLFAFNQLTETEGFILLNRDPGVLLTADAIQSYSTPPHMPHTAWLAQKLFSVTGFPPKTIIGPIWVKKMALDQEVLKRDFERLLELPFDQLLSAHGTFVERGAREEVSSALDKIYG